MFYIRICRGGKDTYLSLETTRKAIAIDLRNARERKQSEAKLGVEPAKAPLPRLLIKSALSTYKKAEFASIRRGKLRRPGEKHNRTEDEVSTITGKAELPGFVRIHFKTSMPDVPGMFRSSNTRQGSGCLARSA